MTMAMGWGSVARVAWLALLLLPIHPSAAEASPDDDHLARALRCHADLDFACAVEASSEAREALPAGVGDPRRLEALRLLAYAHVALGNRALAREAFRELRKEDPEWAPSADTSPRVAAVFAEIASAEVAKPPAAPPPAPPAPAPVASAQAPHAVASEATDPRTALALDIGVDHVVPLGDDGDVLDAGYGPAVAFHTSVSDHVLLGVTVSQRTHEVVLEDLSPGEPTELQVLELGTSAAWVEPLGPLRLSLGARVGAATFGKGDGGLGSNWGALARGSVALQVGVRGPLSLVISVSPGWVINGSGDAGFSSAQGAAVRLAL